MSKKVPNVIAMIEREMACDDENQSEKLISLFSNTGLEEQEAIDKALICICGWTLAKLIKKAVDSGEFVED